MKHPSERPSERLRSRASRPKSQLLQPKDEATHRIHSLFRLQKRWAWVLMLWGCPSDPKTEVDPEQDQEVADAVVDLGIDLDADVEGAALTLEGRGPCALTLGVPRPGEVATGDFLAVEITVRGIDPAAADGRIAAGTEVVFRQGDETADAAQVVAFVGVFDEALAEGASVAEAVQAAAVGRTRIVEGVAADRVFCVGVGPIEITAEITDYPGQGRVVAPESQRLTIECVPGAVYRAQCGGGDAGTPDAGVDFDAGVDASGRDAQPADGALPDRGPPVDALVLFPEAGPPDAEPVLDAGAPDMADPNAPPPPLRCAPVRPAGGECYGDDRACEPGLTCISGRCAPPSPAEGDCETANDCQANLYCRAYSLNGEPLAIGICSARGAVGDACHRRNFGCEFGLTCLFDLCAELSTFDGPCLTTGDCDRNTWCDRPQGIEVGTCRGFELEGAVCDPLNNGCGPNLACLNGICGFRQPMGGGCGQAADCQPSQYCDRLDENGNPRVEPICLDRLEVGDACEPREGSVCRQSRCIQGLCAVDQPLGAACDSTFDCAAGGFCPQP